MAEAMVGAQHPAGTISVQPTIADARQIADQVAGRLVAAIASATKEGGHFVLAPSAGRTFMPVYEVLRQRHRDSVDWRKVVCVQMDEYADLGCVDPRSFAHQLQQDLIGPLGIGRTLCFHDALGRPTMSFDDYDRSIRDMGGIDAVLHGVGCNGHVAFNEPGSIHPGKTRRLLLAASTRAANGVPFREGVSLGLDVLLRARSSIVVLTGATKREAARMLMMSPPTPECPVAYLRSAPNLCIYMDQQAAGGTLRLD